MIGDKYIVKEDVPMMFWTLKKGDILTEKETYNVKKKCMEDAGGENELTHDEYGYICDVECDFTRAHIDKLPDFAKSAIQSYDKMIEHYEVVLQDLSGKIYDPKLEAEKESVVLFLKQMQERWRGCKEEFVKQF